MKLYEILKTEIGSNAEIGRRFPAKGKPRTGQAVGKWHSQGVPEDIALLCHLSSCIPYTYNPADYGRNPENLSLVLTKPAHQ
ncbi:hypothetical protein [Yersinia enterocolitica]|uniref:hypothetical protein n=1 Tax=Yersinia enterocolitica TaxID=630 RepID=UPI00313DC144